MALAGTVILIVVVLLVAVVLTATAGARSAKAGDTGTAEVQGPTVAYRVPEGQDPVAVVTHLRQSGYDAELGDPPAPPTVVVVCPPEGRDELRRAIATAPLAVDDSPSNDAVPAQVRFTDE